jgi:threonine-phosphate decarboxylase
MNPDEAIITRRAARPGGLSGRSPKYAGGGADPDPWPENEEEVNIVTTEPRKHLFYETSHSPSLADLVGYEKAKDIIDFCFIANPYYPTPDMLDDLKENFTNLIRSYPSSNPITSQKNLASVLNVNPDHLIIGNGATELIVLINTTLIERIAVPVPTFGEYIEKLNDQRDAELFALKAEEKYKLDLTEYLAWVRRRGLKALLIINPGNPTGQLFSLDEMTDFLQRAKDMELVIVDESFIDFAGDPIPSMLPIADRFSNLLLVRSMSKHCGVPGLRLGYCYSGNLFVLNRMRQFIPTWNVNTLAQYFLSLLPSTDAAYHVARKRLTADVCWLFDALQAMPEIDVYPTGANFVLFRIKGGMTAVELQSRLLSEHRMYVRDCSNKIGMDRFHIRVASQGREKDAKLVDALRKLLR